MISTHLEESLKASFVSFIEREDIMKLLGALPLEVSRRNVLQNESRDFGLNTLGVERNSDKFLQGQSVNAPDVIFRGLFDQRQVVAISEGGFKKEGGATALQIAIRNDGNPVPENLSFIHVVGGEENCSTSFVFDEQIPDGSSSKRIHPRSRFVQNHSPWPCDKGDCHRQLALHSSRETIDCVVPLLGQTQIFNHSANRRQLGDQKDSLVKCIRFPLGRDIPISFLPDIINRQTLQSSIKPQMLLHSESVIKKTRLMDHRMISLSVIQNWYSLIKQDIMLWTHSEWSADLIHVSSYIISINHGITFGGWEQASEDGPGICQDWIVFALGLRQNLDRIWCGWLTWL